MTLEYHIGDPASPKGHALIYFRDGSDPDKVGAAYVVMLPVSVDISKYVPPFLAGQVEQLGTGNMSSFAFPRLPNPCHPTRGYERSRSTVVTTCCSVV